MPASLNRVFLMGNLTRDPELRYVPSGTAVASFTIAVNRYYNTASGERKEETSFVRIVVWGRRAEVCGEYLSKGSGVFVEGRLRTRSWEAQDGQKRTAVEVVASSVQFLRPAKEAPSAPSGEVPVDQEIPEDVIMNQNAKGPKEGAEDSDQPSTSEDKVPF